MPMDRARYPTDWEAVSREVRRKANGRCMWCGATNGQPHPRTGSRVVLTVAHLGLPRVGDWRCWGDPHDKHDTRDGNLAALCQSCHLSYDRDDHIRNAAATRRRKKEEAGQAVLPCDHARNAAETRRRRKQEAGQGVLA